ncbi:MAG: gamma-glutamyltransferase, partial [Sphingomonadales bacterium]|nr:gamma-glutamyltransferase [Sphingomonadales bacterium]
MSKLTRRQFVASATGTAAAGVLAGCATAPKTGPRAVTGWAAPDDDERRRLIAMAEFGRKQAVSGTDGVAVSTHPLATAAARDVLKLGGNAVDAICSASLAQAVVEPHMTTLSGVFSMLHYEAATGTLSYVNGSA